MLQQPDVKMVTMNAPTTLLDNFDELRKFNRQSRTSTIISLMKQYVREEYAKLKEDNKLNHLIMDNKLRNKPIEKPQKNGWSRWIKDETKWEDSY